MKKLLIAALFIAGVPATTAANACTPPGNCTGQACTAAYQAYNACLSAQNNPAPRGLGQQSSPDTTGAPRSPSNTNNSSRVTPQ